MYIPSLLSADCILAACAFTSQHSKKPGESPQTVFRAFPPPTFRVRMRVYGAGSRGYTDIKVKITMKTSPYQKFVIHEVCVRYSYFSQNRNVLLVLNPVEEAKLNNCSTYKLQILHEDI